MRIYGGGVRATLNWDLVQRLRYGTAFGAVFIQAGVAAQFSLAILFNPSGSGSFLYPYLLVLSQGQSVDVTVQRLTSDPGIAAGPTPVPLSFGSTQTVKAATELGTNASIPTGNQFHDLRAANAPFGSLSPFPFCRITPGTGLMVASSAVNTVIEVTIHWTEQSN